MVGRRMNYARLQQYRRLSRAGWLGLASGAMALLGLFLVSGGAAPLGGLILLAALVLGLRVRHWLSLAGRSQVGARSEDEVRRTLAPLLREGWRLRHALRWPGRGDIDSVAIAPTGMAFAMRRRLGRMRIDTLQAFGSKRVAGSSATTLVPAVRSACCASFGPAA